MLGAFSLARKISILVVDDSPITCKTYKKLLQKDPLLEVIASAEDGREGVEKAKLLQPDVIILDVEMPVMSGIEAIPHLLEVSPESKIIIASGLTFEGAEVSMEALRLGAADCMAKPDIEWTGDFYKELAEKIKELAQGISPVQAMTAARTPEIFRSSAKAVKAETANYHFLPETTYPVQALAIACSTGGPQALFSLLPHLKPSLEKIPVYIIQHIPEAFTQSFCRNLEAAAGVKVYEGANRLPVTPGNIYVAPGDFHMEVERKEGVVRTVIHKGAKQCFCRPAADAFLPSMAEIYGKSAMALVLTGMGKDSMEGNAALVAKGGCVLAQSPETCVIPSMPKANLEKGQCQKMLPLSAIADYINQRVVGD